MGINHDRRKYVEPRTFLKGAVATGAAATGLAFSGGASAQTGSIDTDNFIQQNGLVTITLQDVADIAFDTVEVNILGPEGVQNIDVTVHDVIDITDNTVIVTIENVLSDISVDVNNVVVQVNLLSGGNTIGQFQDTAFVVDPHV